MILYYHVLPHDFHTPRYIHNNFQGFLQVWRQLMERHLNTEAAFDPLNACALGWLSGTGAVEVSVEKYVENISNWMV